MATFLAIILALVIAFNLGFFGAFMMVGHLGASTPSFRKALNDLWEDDIED